MLGLTKEQAELVVDWFQKNKRSMAWRDNPKPYYVWISEIMLQQTRIEAVKAYFERFTNELPDVSALAKVDNERLMKLWEGLGYYNRARNLKKAAMVIMEKHNGVIPCDYDVLVTLPGIGSYTAGAISSIAYNKKAPAVDGNVLRVLTRVHACSEDIMKQSFRKKVERELLSTMPDEAGDFNQGLMEIGETVCIPNGEPLCEKCPLENECKARKEGTQLSYPVKNIKKTRRKEKRTVFILEHEGRLAIRKRDPSGLLAGLWEFPSVDSHITKKEVSGLFKNKTKICSLTRYTHVFSHVEWEMKAYHILLSEIENIEMLPQDILWIEKNQIKKAYSLPVAFHSFFSEIMN